MHKSNTRIVHRVELVDGKHHRGHTQQVQEQGVATGLRQEFEVGVGPLQLGGIYQHHGGVGAAGGSNHVAGVLLVAGRVTNNEFALLGAEVPVRHVNGDALLALGAQAVGQQSQVHSGARVIGVGLVTLTGHASKVVLQHRTGV